jgi:peptide/nickel transport system permease protein
LQLLPLLLLMSVLLYAALSLMPGDPISQMLQGLPGVTPEQYARLRAFYGLDDPFYVRYFKWIWAFVQGNPGFSLAYNLPVFDLILPRLANTLLLSFTSLVIGVTIAILIGVVAAVKQYSIVDHLSMGFAFIGFSIPGFWLGLMVIVLFAVHWKLLPVGGLLDPRTAPGFWPSLGDRVSHLILPVAVLSFSSTAFTARYMRTSLLDVLRQDYLNTARAKGLAERAVITRHALKIALIPVVTEVARLIPDVVGGATVIETVFGYPGMGKLLFDSIIGSDFTVVMCILMLLATMVVLFNLLADVMYAYLDPRIRYS